MKISIQNPIDQPKGDNRLLEQLRENLGNDQFDTFQFITAFAQSNPFLKLEPIIKEWIGKGKKIEVIFGVDQNGTSLQALEFALNNFTSTHVVHFAKHSFGPIFHPKMYIFTGAQTGLVYIGSNNFTVGGLETNAEANIRIDFEVVTDREFSVDIKNSWYSTLEVSRKLNEALLKELVDCGLVIDEREMVGRRLATNRLLEPSVKVRPPVFPTITMRSASVSAGIPLSREVVVSEIDQDWVEYAQYLNKNTSSGSKFHWKVGNKNDHLDVHVWALRYIHNHAQSQTAGEIDTHIREGSKIEFPEKTMEGTRALFFSKLLGFLKDTNPLLTTAVFDEINALGKQSTETAEFSQIVSNQLEKLYFWNDLFSETDRHTPREERKPVHKHFAIYPLMFIYEVILKLKDDFGYTYMSLSKLEFDTFLALARTHAEIDTIVQMIVALRRHSDKARIEEFLKKSNEMDSRFYKVLRYSKYFTYDIEQIVLKEEYVDVVRDKVSQFNKLIATDTLIRFSEENPKEYRDMLYSPLSLLEYHNVRS